MYFISTGFIYSIYIGWVPCSHSCQNHVGFQVVFGLTADMISSSNSCFLIVGNCHFVCSH